MKVKINKEIFRYHSLQKALAAYKGYAEFSISEEQDSWVVELAKCRYDESLTAKEFENYLIGVENT